MIPVHLSIYSSRFRPVTISTPSLPVSGSNRCPSPRSCAVPWLERFRTPSTCFEPNLHVIAVSGDRPDRLAPGEPSLWRILRERVTVSSTISSTVPSLSSGVELERQHRPIDVVLHAGGQAWMADAFEDAWELLKRRAMEPVLCADGGWREAQEEATERLREVTDSDEYIQQ